MNIAINDRAPVQCRRERTKLAVTLLLILSVLTIGYLSLLNVQDGIREYRRLSQETLPVISSLERLKFLSLRIVASASELGMISYLKTETAAEKNTAMAQEERYLVQGFNQFSLELVNYREMVQRHFPQEASEAELLFHEGNIFRSQAEKLLAKIREGVGSHEVFQLKELMERSEERFLTQAASILKHEAEEISERDEVITNALERQIWMLWLGGILLIGLLVLQRRIGLSCLKGD